MTNDALFQHWIRARHTFLQSLIELGPALIVPICIAALALIWARLADKDLLNAMTEGQGSSAMALETLVFGLLGVALAYLSFMTRNSIITEVTTSLLAGGAVLLQLLGLSTQKFSPPLSSIKVLWAASAAILSFLVAVRYLALLFKLPIAG